MGSVMCISDRRMSAFNLREQEFLEHWQFPEFMLTNKTKQTLFITSTSICSDSENEWIMRKCCGFIHFCHVFIFCFSIVHIGTFLLHVKLLFCCSASYWVISLMKMADFDNNKATILINTVTYHFWTIELNYLTKILW